MDIKAGKLYLCATPIGNLEDITLRVLNTLKEADLIAAEDTRHSIRLLNHFNIHTPMTSYHEFNKYDKAKYLVEQMKAGQCVALITDAGTPAISDPGEELVCQAYEAGIEVTSLPGPSAAITALTLSGLSTRRFCFEGFLPYDKKERAVILNEIRKEMRTVILYEAPHRLKRTLAELYEAIGDRKVSICRELTKRYETVLRCMLSEAIKAAEEKEPRGEYVLVIEGGDYEALMIDEIKKWSEKTMDEHLQYYLSQDLTKKDAMKQMAKDRGVSKRDIYKALLSEE